MLFAGGGKATKGGVDDDYLHEETEGNAKYWRHILHVFATKRAEV